MSIFKERVSKRSLNCSWFRAVVLEVWSPDQTRVMSAASGLMRAPDCGPHPWPQGSEALRPPNAGCVIRPSGSFWVCWRL